MTRLLVVIVAVTFLLVGIQTALAAPVAPFVGPTDPPSCLGHDRSGFARNGIAALGLSGGSDVALHLIKPLAVGTGFGAEIQGHRAGLPAISTCNK